MGAPPYSGKGRPKFMGINLNWLTPALERARCHFRGRRPQVGKIQIQHWQQLHFRLAAAHPMQILRIAVSGKRTTKSSPNLCGWVGWARKCPLEQTWRCYLRRFAVDHWNRFAKQRLHWTRLPPHFGTTGWQNVGATRCSVGSCGWLVR